MFARKNTLRKLKSNSANKLLKSLRAPLLLSCAILLTGCRMLPTETNGPNLYGEPLVANPLLAPMMDRWYIMDQVSDELDDYFRILREERVQLIDNVLTEGWIETHPKIGSTVLEPWRRDSTPGFEKVHATLQTVRRFAKVRVIPNGNSYQIDVKVYKELEDLVQPIGSAVGGPLLRHDNSLDVDQQDPWSGSRNPGWIPRGRDISLEQMILRNIQGRLAVGIE